VRGRRRTRNFGRRPGAMLGEASVYHGEREIIARD
jgi:hypothetical protein